MERDICFGIERFDFWDDVTYSTQATFLSRHKISNDTTMLKSTKIHVNYNHQSTILWHQNDQRQLASKPGIENTNRVSCVKFK